jgi:hypothetical protein
MGRITPENAEKGLFWVACDRRLKTMKNKTGEWGQRAGKRGMGPLQQKQRLSEKSRAAFSFLRKRDSIGV